MSLNLDHNNTEESDSYHIVAGYSSENILRETGRVGLQKIDISECPTNNQGILYLLTEKK